MASGPRGHHRRTMRTTHTWSAHRKIIQYHPRHQSQQQVWEVSGNEPSETAHSTANSPASNTELKHQITLQVLPTTISQHPITSFICKVCSQNLVRPGQGPDYTPPSDREKNTGTKMPKSSMPMYLYISNQHNTTEKKEPTNQEKVNGSWLIWPDHRNGWLTGITPI